MSATTPFEQRSELPFELPPFDRIRDEHYRPAFLAGMAAQRAEVRDIAGRPASVEATLLGLERSGRLLDRVSNVFFNLAVANGSPAQLELEREIAPLLAQHHDAIYLDEQLFNRLDSLYQRRALLDLDPETQQLLTRYHVNFVRAGASLSDSDKNALRELNRELSVLRTRFRQNVLAATREGGLWVDSAALLAGLSSSEISAAAQAAQARGRPDCWLLALQNTTTQPALAQLHDRDLRQRLFEASANRNRGGAFDNTAVIAQLVRLRAARAQLLGFASHAAHVLADENARTPAAVQQMLAAVTTPAMAQARERAAQLQRRIDAEAVTAQRTSFTLQSWDWHYYVERERQARYAFDSGSVKAYFELERALQDGLFYTARELYGVTFELRTDLPVYHPDVRAFEVRDAGGAPLALFLADYYARDHKQGGAWMSQFVAQSRLLGQQPVIVNCLNIPKPASGERTLLTFEELTTLFHEFGHALHGMLSDVQYPLLSGTHVPHDFVEYPSQFHEMWTRDASVLTRFARHCQSGEALPKALLTQIVASQNFNQGYQTSEYLQAALLDQAWHALEPAGAPAAAAVMEFEQQVLLGSGLQCPAIPPRYHSPYFLHIFADDYPASYYAYLWSEVLARDTGRWFQERGGLSRANGERLRSLVLSRGSSEDTQQLFREFYGGVPVIGPLLEYRGLTGNSDSWQGSGAAEQLSIRQPVD